MIKKIILVLLTVACMASITFFSTQGAEESTKTSESVTEKIVSHSEKYQKMNKKEKKDYVKNKNTIVRSLAHYSLFLILGFLLNLTLSEFVSSKVFLYTLAFCLLYAVFDEVFQKLLNNGRAFEVVDILKDFLGSATGVLIVSSKNIWNCFKKRLFT